MDIELDSTGIPRCISSTGLGYHGANATTPNRAADELDNGALHL